MQLPSGRPLSAVHISAVGDRVLVRDESNLWEPDSGQTLLDLGASPSAGPDKVPAVAPAGIGVAAEIGAAATIGERSAASADESYNAALDLEGTDPERAMAAYRDALAFDPLHADAHLNLGRLLHEAGELADAEAHYRAAAEAEPESARAHFNLGVLAEDRGRVGDALAAYREALRLDEHLAPAHFNLSRLLEARGEEASALAHLVTYKRLISSRHP